MKRLSITVALFALALAACGGDEPGAAPTTPPPSGGTKPDVTVPAGPPPTSLVIEDVTQGNGAEAKDGATVTVHYVGVSYSTGKQFDASWDRGEPFSFQLPGNVITGWNEGVPGMKVGGRRKLIIPPDKAYGPEGRPPTIKPNETLIFVIDLIEVA